MVKDKPISAKVDLVYGRQPVYEVLRAQRRIMRRIFVQESAIQNDGLRGIFDLCRILNCSVVKTSAGDLTQMVGDVNHQGVAIEVGPYPYDQLSKAEQIVSGKKDSLVLFLDHLQDPQNLGSILRTADAAGVDAVIIPKDRAARVTSATVRASAGASEHVRVVLVVNLVRSMQALKDRGMWIVGLDASSEAKHYTNVDMKGSTGLVVGNEGTGLGRLVRNTCDFLVSLPMAGSIASLNAGVACGIALYEVLRQRRTDPDCQH
ncbi:MAG: 23S rRNA (guanosine(2251)-2'-O)-methyltransferase RlmB [Lentisphaerae bacterium]|nr:23S rRNA (guanosine(2251)-2'-O)-methyltransferase RlmB [Lentisphaerota bacterium]